MAPEQVAGRRADHRCDLFSLGVVLYETLTGETPFQGDNIHGIMYQILNSMPLPPSSRNPDVPQILDLVVAKALARDVEERYQTAKELIEDLKECRSVVQGFTTTQPIARPSPNTLPPAPSATRREDKVLTIRTPNAKSGEPQTEKQGLTLSKAFDSYEATMRLAAMTGMEKDVGELPRTQPVSTAVPTSAAPAPSAVAAKPEPVRRPAKSASRRGSSWLYAITIAALAAAAVVVYLLTQ
jgi:serine/threonine-protein kinase